MSKKVRANILVVEDSLAAAKRLQMSLEQAGFAVDIARNGRDALSKISRTRFDFIVTDEQMPVMSGRELCRQLRSDDRYADTPVVFLTASRSQLDSDELSKELKVTALLEKPFCPEVIVRLVENRLLAARLGHAATG